MGYDLGSASEQNYPAVSTMPEIIHYYTVFQGKIMDFYF